MILKQVIEVYDILDKANANGEEVKTYLQGYGEVDVTVKELSSSKGSTRFSKAYNSWEKWKIKRWRCSYSWYFR